MSKKQPDLIEGEDYYINADGLWVFTERYHRRRGYCCGSGCLHCPYGFGKEESKIIRSVDQMGKDISIPFPPKRIISLVPSQTELLFDLDLEEYIVGTTKFCVHPSDKVKRKEKIGGTKKFNLEKINALQPDLIIGNKEENYSEGIQALQQHYPVWMSDIYTLEDACSMIKGIAEITNKVERGEEIAGEILRRFASYEPLPNHASAAYLIWNEPLMVAANETFIHEMLTRFGVTNAFGQLTRYPEVTIQQLIQTKPDFIFLSSEPYPFKEKHIAAFSDSLPNSRVLIVDGEYFSWYGSRLLKAPEYFKELKDLCISIQER